jgi:hypothetical protein
MTHVLLKSTFLRQAEQKKVSDGFKEKYFANFACKPTEEDCAESKCNSGTLLCGIKHKVDINFQ